MRANYISPLQTVVNKINAKQEFTFPLIPKGRYVVGVKELHSSKNPSLYWDNIHVDLVDIVSDILYNGADRTVGQWYDAEADLYITDEGRTFDSLEEAIECGKAHGQKTIWDNLNEEVITL